VVRPYDAEKKKCVEVEGDDQEVEEEGGACDEGGGELLFRLPERKPALLSSLKHNPVNGG